MLLRSQSKISIKPPLLRQGTTREFISWTMQDRELKHCIYRDDGALNWDIKWISKNSLLLPWKPKKVRKERLSLWRINILNGNRYRHVFGVILKENMCSMQRFFLDLSTSSRFCKIVTQSFFCDFLVFFPLYSNFSLEWPR